MLPEPRDVGLPPAPLQQKPPARVSLRSRAESILAHVHMGKTHFLLSLQLCSFSSITKA